jgi:hypothetical protein
LVASLIAFMLAGRTAFSLPKMASGIFGPATRSMIARASAVAPTSGNAALGLPATATRSRMALMMGWIAWCANSRASMKRSSGNWSALPSIISMSFSLPT